MRGRVVGIVMLPLMNTRLSKKGPPTYPIGTANISTRVIADHKETAITVELFHVVFHKLEGSLFWLAEIALGKLELMPSAVFL